MCGNRAISTLADTGLQMHAYKAVVLIIVSQKMNLCVQFFKVLDGWMRISSTLSSLLNLLYVTCGPELLRLSILYRPDLMKGIRISFAAIEAVRPCDNSGMFGISVSKLMYLSAN